MLPWLERANSFYCPTGRWPCRGWILLPRSEYVQLNSYSTSLQLEVGDSRDPNNVGILKGLCLVQAQCVTRGLATDPNALYLVELTDAQGILFNPWFQFALTTAYNIRAPAYPQTFYPWTLNGGTTWTWSTMLQDMWNKMVAAAPIGTWPGLPFVPAGTPEGFWFPGVTGWPAFVDVLEYLGMTLAVDLTKTNPYTVVKVGAADGAFTSLQAKYATNLEDDLEWIDVGAGRVPGSVVVAFRRRNAVYGTEETVRYDSPYQWKSGAYYTVTVSAPAQFAGAVGTDLLWSDFTVEYDVDGNPLAADTATANIIAQERVTQYYNKIRAVSGYITQTYGGALPFTTGSLVDGVCWYQDYRDNDPYAGWRTQVVRGDFPPWPGLWDTNGLPT